MDDKLTLNTTQLAFLATQLQWQTFRAMMITIEEISSLDEIKETFEATLNQAGFTNTVLALRVSQEKMKEINDFVQKAMMEVMNIASATEGLF